VSKLDPRGLTITVEQKLVTETCCRCGMLYAMTEEFQSARRADKELFYCPSGHGQAYQGKTAEQKLREQLDEERRTRQRAEQNVEYQRQMRVEAEERAKHERSRANGYKGHATRITKRAKAGVCPCCNRTFQQLARHMQTQHPRFTPLEVIDGGKAT
jgi:hypothetical protein